MLYTNLRKSQIERSLVHHLVQGVTDENHATQVARALIEQIFRVSPDPELVALVAEAVLDTLRDPEAVVLRSYWLLESVKDHATARSRVMDDWTVDGEFRDQNRQFPAVILDGDGRVWTNGLILADQRGLDPKTLRDAIWRIMDLPRWAYHSESKGGGRTTVSRGLTLRLKTRPTRGVTGSKVHYYRLPASIGYDRKAGRYDRAAGLVVRSEPEPEPEPELI